jgi:Asp-tRNA(Asn)/Glu-tRNA(Gln) amidotransferase A subunit family amidase
MGECLWYVSRFTFHVVVNSLNSKRAEKVWTWRIEYKMANSPLSLATIAGALRSGDWPLLDYVDQLEARFEQREAEVLAFLPEAGRFDRLRREAKALLERYPEVETRPPLFGVPLGVKDIFHAQGFVTRAGSQVPIEQSPDDEAASVTILRRAGALILGKTVTTEFAYFAPGPTRNPHRLEHTPGGSSSGSAAAVAAGLCPLALGTQTIGSVNRPAAFCGVVGYKPSYDRIARAGVIPLAPALDHVGFFTPSMDGADLVASLLCRQWQDLVMLDSPLLGIAEGPYLEQASPEALAHFQVTCQRLRAAGFKLKAAPAMSDFADIYERHNLIVAAEAAQVHAAWFARYEELYQAKTAELIRRGQQVDRETLAQALKGRLKLRDELTRLMDEHGLDLWLSPSAPGPAPKGLASTGSPVMNLPWTHSGLPTVTLPAGLNADGLPMAVQLTGRWYADEAMLAWAMDVEIALH